MLALSSMTAGQGADAPAARTAIAIFAQWEKTLLVCCVFVLLAGTASPVEFEPQWGCGSYIRPVAMVRRFTLGGDGVGDVGRISGFWPFGVPRKMGGRLCCSFCCGLCGPVGGWELFHSACIAAFCPSIHSCIHSSMNPSHLISLHFVFTSSIHEFTSQR